MNHPLLPPPQDSRSTIPKVLYRRFEHREHAENFLLNGEIRFKTLAHYRKLDDEARKDNYEGSAYVNDATGITLEVAPAGTTDYGAAIKMTGPFRKHLSYPERFLISSYSYRRHPAQQKFGKWLVRINRARPFLNAFGKRNPYLFWGRVQYFDPDNVAHVGRANRLWLSKPIQKRHEHEFRLLLMLYREGQTEDAWARITLGDLSDFGEVIEDVSQSGAPIVASPLVRPSYPL